MPNKPDQAPDDFTVVPSRPHVGQLRACYVEWIWRLADRPDMFAFGTAQAGNGEVGRCNRLHIAKPQA